MHLPRDTRWIKFVMPKIERIESKEEPMNVKFVTTLIHSKNLSVTIVKNVKVFLMSDLKFDTFIVIIILIVSDHSVYLSRCENDFGPGFVA